MAIFHSYVILPEGSTQRLFWWVHLFHDFKSHSNLITERMVYRPYQKDILRVS